MVKGLILCLCAGLGLFFFTKEKKSHSVQPSMPQVRFVKTPKVPIQRTSENLRTKTKTIVSEQPLEENRKKQTTYPEIQALINNDDVCGMIKLVYHNNLDVRERTFIDAFFEHIGKESLKEIYGVNGSLRKKGEAKKDSEEHQLVEALALSDLVGSQREDKDTEASLAIIKELQRKNPQNALYSLLRASLELQSGDKQDARKAAEQILQAESYTSSMTKSALDIRKFMWESPTMYFLTSAVLGNMPNLQISTALSALRAAVEDEKIFEHLGNLMVKEGLKSEKTYMSGEFNYDEYYYGNTLLNHKHPNLGELAEEKQPGKMDEIQEATQHLYEMYSREVCDRTIIDEFFKNHKNIY
jgi:hypothetical protein